MHTCKCNITCVFTELECPVPVISHGSVNTNKTVLGDEITVTCESGYEINGSASLRCNVNQTFGTNIPFCQGMVNHNAKFDLIQHQIQLQLFMALYSM